MNELKKNLLKDAKIETSGKTVKVSISLKRENNRKFWAKLVDLEVKIWLNDNGYNVGKLLKRGDVSNFESDDNLSEIFLFEKKTRKVTVKAKVDEKKEQVTLTKIPTKKTRTRKKKTKEE